MQDNTVRKEHADTASKYASITPKKRHGQEPDAEGAGDAYKEARARSREALMLDVFLKDGTVESFDYATPKRATYRPDGTLLLQFGEDGIKIRGRNLERVRVAVTECRLRFIREGTLAEADIHPDDATYIESITVQRAGLEW
jgi:hypothetical protein